MRSIQLVLVKLVIFQCIMLLHAQDFDFFYFAQQWNPASCDSKIKCCYPTNGKPAQDFGIHGLWPNYNNGSFPKSCNKNARYDETQISDLISSMQKNWPTLSCPSNNGTRFWSHEWKKHGIKPDGGFYSYEAMKEAIEKGIGHTVGVECNIDLFGNRQLFEVYVCVDKCGSEIIDCPIVPESKRCKESIEFAVFESESLLDEKSAYSL
ncbi:intracellular ribonuclease LX-like isoform X2 [Nicotiana tabacum]|uniref:Intracellular ribonuclease LX-like isoform X2 n=2 Tax=Nicotiana TaxID=4085 RepID=A0A1S4CT53_TOBAC|nr:PREDICTED: intracellular ribonuclease LX-like isoform X2 [Nicotiana sylvestris]XP_016504184.1 PREDICTED: intracellular ribonuclease LX-like isoform X2 [Nicotiana tabacum]